MIFVVLPAYNEALAIANLLNTIQRIREEFSLPLKVIVVNDGSRDDTAAQVQSFQREWVQLVQHAENRGLSEAIQTGFRAVLKEAQPDDILITMDADNTQPASLIPQMASQIAAGYDVVIASRFVRGARVVGLSPLRKLYSAGASWIFRILFPISGVKDYTCGYRAYRVRTLRKAMQYFENDFITLQGFSCMTEILLKLRRLRVPMTEVPLVLRYDWKQGASKMNVSKNIRNTLKIAVREQFASKTAVK